MTWTNAVRIAKAGHPGEDIMIKAARVPLLLAALLASTAACAADDLAAGFADPPASARPRTWWHWLNGNITVEGLDADLTWMKQVGLGGVQAFDASLGTPQLVAHPIAYMTPDWKAAFNHAAATADRLGLEFGISSSPGWSETGGPWVAPADGMKKLAWSTLDVTGGKPVTGRLVPPPTVTGPYGSSPFVDPMAAPGPPSSSAIAAAFGPVATFAYPLRSDPPGGLPAVSVEGGTVLDAALLNDGREDTAVALPRSAGTVPTMLLAWPKPQVFRSATVFVPGAVAPFGGAKFSPVLEAETPAGWTRIADLPLGNVPTTIGFAPVRASRFRIRFPASSSAPPTLGAPAPGAVVADIFASNDAERVITVATLAFWSEDRVDHFEDKAGFAAVPDYYALSQAVPAAAGISPASVVDLTGRVRPDGTLDWTPPPGRWRVVRMGWSLLGTTNHPAAPESTGLEVDKYDGAAVRRYLTYYLDTYRQAISAGGVKALVTDSIEAGDANWTPGMFDRFRTLRGYDPRPWLPALTGAIVTSREASDAFLYDWRRTLADLLATEHYGTIAAIAHADGLKVYGEALENGRPQLGDDLQMRAHADVPMAAMWAFGRGEAPRSTLIGDIYGAASVAHLTGRNLVAAESFTAAFSPWAFAPADLKRVADLEFALGVNRPVIHTSVSSPMDDRLPGLSLAIFGQYFNRRDTWSGMARPWIDYLARTAFLMQQGRHVADLAYFVGEEAPLTALYQRQPLGDTPRERGFDFVDADSLASLRVDGRELVSPGGARYRMLYLGGTSRRMTLPTLRRIAALAEAGATIVGAAPADTPSLADDPHAFAALVARLWPGGAAAAAVGRGQVHATNDIEAVFTQQDLPPDLATTGGGILFQHRVLPEADIYLVHNSTQVAAPGPIAFRVTGRAPELWDPDTGEHRPLSFRVDKGRTTVSLPLDAEGTALVVFRKPALGPGVILPSTREQEVGRAEGPWKITFQPGRGAPETLRLPALGDLARQRDPAIRYFSGVASYDGTVTLARRPAHSRLLLDLGQVGDVAEVRINGSPAGTVWHAPYRLDVTDAIRSGTNRIEVRVADLWVNRLIGDAQPGAAKIAFVAAPTYRPDAPLRPAGLIGPVRLVARSETGR
jgi:hypothetical protein